MLPKAKGERAGGIGDLVPICNVQICRCRPARHFEAGEFVRSVLSKLPLLLLVVSDLQMHIGGLVIRATQYDNPLAVC
jgi:hypothetical protein